MSVPVSILICTRDHLGPLRETMQTVAGLAVPPDLDPELVVVDNGSTDGTAAWARTVRLPNIPVRVVEAPRPGQARARNAGLAAARGEIILFTDDDVDLPANWLAAMCAPILAGAADAVRGTSVLHPALVRPWMQVFHRAVLAVTEGMDEDRRADMVGLSMGFHRRVLARVPGFDPDLGPGTYYGFFDDTLFSYQVQAAGFRVATVREAPVVHRPDASRLGRAAYLHAARCRGRGLTYIAYHWRHEPEARWTRRTRPWQVWRHPWAVLAIRRLRLGLWRLTHPRAVRRREGIDLAEFLLVNQYEQAREYVRLRRRPRAYAREGLVKQAGEVPDGQAPAPRPAEVSP
ncbi:glycosyltransferase [Rhodocaloribacter litoris]|uniref:glycosyltransferase family 2 protein n=1 Tax=Rhodocaloribacter litoris TaxID=2558931 RepID=UPI00141E141A|nr:glycosyltransferase [Rhodocaloribacter litoris]QXD16153.1 glycosyltransferase [Rhodocaloribacter litoris]